MHAHLFPLVVQEEDSTHEHVLQANFDIHCHIIRQGTKILHAGRGTLKSRKRAKMQPTMMPNHLYCWSDVSVIMYLARVCW